MITIIFEAHATSLDNESGLASGWNDVDLSERGMERAIGLGARYKGKLPNVVFCSDLQRSYKTAALAFRNTRVPLIIDARLRECHYGELTRAPNDVVQAQRIKHLTAPFPYGESYKDTSQRMKSFLGDLKKYYDDQTVMIIGHRATQYGLEEHILGRNLSAVLTAPLSGSQVGPTSYKILS